MFSGADTGIEVEGSEWIGSEEEEEQGRAIHSNIRCAVAPTSMPGSTGLSEPPGSRYKYKDLQDGGALAAAGMLPYSLAVLCKHHRRWRRRRTEDP